MSIFAGDIFEIAMEGHLYGQLTINAWQYQTVTASVGASAAELGEAWWNHVKTAYRAIPTSDHGNAFELVRVRQLTGTGGLFGFYAVPVGERGGTRTSDGNPPLTPFAAAGMRLVVGTNVTRPGQKRFGGIGEADNNSGSLGAAATAAVEALGAVAAGHLLLGAPTALLELQCVVVRKDQATGGVTAFQEVTGVVVNPYLTTQNTRKFGRGS